MKTGNRIALSSTHLALFSTNVDNSVKGVLDNFSLRNFTFDWLGHVVHTTEGTTGTSVASGTTRSSRAIRASRSTWALRTNGTLGA